MQIKIGSKVVVTTKYRGVFFGTLNKNDGDIVVLSCGRNCLYWTSEVKGFIGLAITGPNAKCRVGPACDEIELRGVTSVIACTDDAAKAWELGPWQ